MGLEKVRRAKEGGGKLVWNANPPKCHKDHTQLLHNIISMLLKKVFMNTLFLTKSKSTRMSQRSHSAPAYYDFYEEVIFKRKSTKK